MVSTIWQSAKVIKDIETIIYYSELPANEYFKLSLFPKGNVLYYSFILSGEVTSSGEVCGDNAEITKNNSLGAWFHAPYTPISLISRTETKIISVGFPSQVFKEFGIDEYPDFFKINYTSGLLCPVSSFLESTYHMCLPTSSITSYFIEKLIHEMIGGMALENFGISKNGTFRRSAFDQAMALIAASAEDCALTPQTLADRLSVSLRQLQRDFKYNGLTIAGTIKRQRSELAVRLLKDKNFEMISLTKIAEFSGFRSVVQLRKALKTMGLGKPSDYR